MVHQCVILQPILNSGKSDLGLVIGGTRRSDGNYANGRSELIVDPVRKFAQQQTCFVGDSGGEDCLLRHVSVLFDRAEKCSLRLGTFLDALRLQERIPFPRTSTLRPICNVVAQFSRPTGGIGLGSAPRRSVKLIQGMCFTSWRPQRGRCFAHTGCFNAVVSIGSLRKRLPVAAKIALVTAGGVADVPHSPLPPGGREP